MTWIWHGILSINVWFLTKRLPCKIHGFKKSFKGEGHSFSCACQIGNEVENWAQSYWLWSFCHETHGALPGCLKKLGLWTCCWGKSPRPTVRCSEDKICTTDSITWMQQTEGSCGVSDFWTTCEESWIGEAENKRKKAKGY